MIIKCPECGHQVSDQAKTCPSCGIDIAGKITQCPDCGEVIFKEQARCPNCHCSINGASSTDNTPYPQPVPPGKTPVPLQPKTRQEETAKPGTSRSSKKKRIGFTVLAVSVVLALIVVFLGIYFMKNQEMQNEMRAYENAVKSTEPLVLQNFLDMYVDAPKAHRDTIKLHLDALKKIDTDWNDALVNNSKYAYERFVKLHPQSVHNIEAAIKIDSLDWVAATKENTAEAFMKYITEHEDGAFYDEAQANYEHLEAQKVTSEERQMVTQLFTTYFNALAQMDVSALSSTLTPVLTSFLHRQNATREDVYQYMEKLHEPGITKMEFTPNGDWSIEKSQVGDDRYVLSVTFTVAEHIERAEEGRESSAVCKVTAQVSPEGRISELNMKRSIAQE